MKHYLLCSQREKEGKMGRAAIDSTYNGWKGGGHKFKIYLQLWEVSRRFSLVVLVKAVLVKERHFETGKIKRWKAEEK
jgi:hypothetical protein